LVDDAELAISATASLQLNPAQLMEIHMTEEKLTLTSEVESGSTFLEWALAYARKGYNVFPLQPGGKAPLTELCPRGHLNATTDEGVIMSWWEQFPTANIGIACASSGIIAIDIDRHEGKPDGVEKYKRLEGYEKSPFGPQALTGSGGLHLIYRAPELKDAESVKGKIS